MEPTQEQLPDLVDQALTLVQQRLSGGQGTGLYDSILHQLEFVRDSLTSPAAPDPAKVDSLLLGVYAARELENTDPEVADLLFAIEYLFKRRSWPAPAEPDLAPLFERCMKGSARPQAIVAFVVLLSGLFMGFLAVVVDTWIVGKVVFVGFALVGLGSAAWLIALLASGARRRATLLDTLEHHPERIERIYAGVVVNYGFRGARMHAIPEPEADHLGERSRRLYIVVTRNDVTPLQRRFGLHLTSVPVARDELLPLLGWLRSKAPAAGGYPST